MRLDEDWSTACSAVLQAEIENGAKGLSNGENLLRSPVWMVRGFEAYKYGGKEKKYYTRIN